VKLAADQRARADRKGWEAREAGLQSLQQRLDGVANEIAELRRQPILSLALGPPKAWLEPEQARSQALRLQRCGDSPAQIDDALELPRQEIDLRLRGPPHRGAKRITTDRRQLLIRD
jgi:hypothetical protein